MTRTNDFYKQLQQLSYSVYNVEKYPRPKGWTRIEKFENAETGFYAEAFSSPDGEIFFVPRATESGLDTDFDKKDFYNDWQLFNYELPDQLEDTFRAYSDLVDKYGKDVKATGYSLAGTLVAALSNETGIEAVTFEAYGIGGFVPEKHTENIINFGNENDPIFLKELDNHLGKVYVIPNDDKKALNPPIEGRANPKDIYDYHTPNNTGDLDRAIEYHGPSKVLKGSVDYENFDDNIFDSRNRVYYDGELKTMDDLDVEDIDNFWNQALEKGGLPSKEELDARTKSSELVYVDSYTRADGTEVSGYYRKCPR